MPVLTREKKGGGNPSVACAGQWLVALRVRGEIDSRRDAGMTDEAGFRPLAQKQPKQRDHRSNDPKHQPDHPFDQPHFGPVKVGFEFGNGLGKVSFGGKILEVGFEVGFGLGKISFEFGKILEVGFEVGFEVGL